ncbi:MAG TPA: hypothetical protein PK794_09665, partial [Armatimonadota bacterium]|nr:hypothetical protein [Armatimonadota bacterium]
PPVRIEPVEIAVPVAPKAAARADKERQAPLFFDAPGGALPPLHLLAEAAQMGASPDEVWAVLAARMRASAEPAPAPGE